MKIAVVGTGLIAHTNVDALLRTKRCEIVAVSNRTLEKGMDFAKEFHLNVPVFSNDEELLSFGAFDAVLINTPHAMHAEQVMRYARHGKHIMVEKPLGVNVIECQQMIESVKQAGVRAVVCHTQRYGPMIRAMKAYLNSAQGQSLGRLRHVQDNINFTYFHDRRPKWFLDPKQAGGGMILNHGAHQVDRIHWLMGVEESVLKEARLEMLEAYPNIDSGYQLFGMAGDVSYTIACAGYPSPHTSTVQMDFENGCLRAELFDNGLVKAGVYGGGDEGFRPLPMPYEESQTYVHQFHDLLNAIEGKENDAPSIEHALGVIQVLDAAMKKE